MTLLMVIVMAVVVVIALKAAGVGGKNNKTPLVCHGMLLILAFCTYASALQGQPYSRCTWEHIDTWT